MELFSLSHVWVFPCPSWLKPGSKYNHAKSECLGVGDMRMCLEDFLRWRMVNLKALFQMWALLIRTSNTLKSSMNFLMMEWGGLFIVGIIGHDAPMTQANSGTVVDSAK